MKQRLSLFLLSLLFPLTIAAKDAYAHYYNGVLTFYYDNQKSQRTEGDIYNVQDGNSGWYLKHEELTRVVFDKSFQDYDGLKSTSCWFCENPEITIIEGLSFLNTSKVRDMSWMFSGCSKLTSLDLSSFNTSNVEDMQGMFCECKELSNLDVGNFDTRNVANMSHMFDNCSKLNNLDVSGLNTQKVTNMKGLFSGCSNIENLNVSSFDTRNVTDMSYMFSFCPKLSSLDLSNFKTQNVENMEGMFCHCSELSILNVNSLETKNVTNMSYMFYGCSKLSSLNVSNFNTEKVTNMGYMFSFCSNLTDIDVSGFNTSNVTSMHYMFAICNGIQELDVSGFDTRKVTDMWGMFADCKNLSSIVISADFGINATDLTMFFPYSQSFRSGTVTIKGSTPYTGSTDIFEGFITAGTLNAEILTAEQLGIVNNTWRGGVFVAGNVINTDEVVIATIATNKPLIEVARQQGWIASDATQMTKADAEKVTDIGTAFKYNSNIVSLVELEFFTNLNLIPSETFYSCSNLVTITIPNSVTTIGNEAFSGCSSLMSLTIPNSVVSIGDGAFHYCFNLNSVVIPNSVKSIGTNPFIHCRNLISFSVESGNTVYDSRNDCKAIIESSTNKLIAGCMNTIIPNSVTSIGVSAFEGCTGIKSIIIPNSVKAIGDNAFCNSSVMTSVTIPNSVIFIGERAFFGCSSLTSIVVEEGNLVYDSRNSCNAIINSSTNQLMSGCVNTIIPQSVTSIGADAFAGCIGLTSFTIPQNVTSIGKQAFWYCNNLTSVKVEMKEPLVIDENTFSNRANAVLYVPKGSAEAYSKADYWNDFMQIMPIGDANGDGAIDDADVEETADFIMDRPSETFVEAAADMNGDGVINVADIVLMNAINSKSN